MKTEESSAVLSRISPSRTYVSPLHKKWTGRLRLKNYRVIDVPVRRFVVAIVVVVFRCIIRQETAPFV